MTIAVLLIIFLMSLGASFTQRVCGFGFGIFIMTVLPFIMPSYGEATALSGSLAIFTALLPAIREVKSVNWKKLLPILATFTIVSFFFVMLVPHVDSHVLRKILGGVMVFISIYFFFISERIRLRPTMPVQISMGTLSGAMGGLFAMQGPPAVIYFLGCTDDKHEYMAMTQWYFLIGNIMMTAFRAGNGLVTASVGKGWLAGIVGVMLGLFLGSKIFMKINIKLLRKLVYAFMAVAGILAIIF